MSDTPKYPTNGKAPTTRFSRDLTICDGCGEPATTMRDLSIQLPDYYGFCDKCIQVAEKKT